MFDPTQAAYAHGTRVAQESFGLAKVAFGLPAGGMAALKAGITGAKRIASNVPVAGAVINTGLGAAQGLMNGEGLKGAVVRGAISGGTGLISSPGLGMAAGMAGDAAADKLLAPKAAPSTLTNYQGAKGPATAPMPGEMGQGHLPGFVS
jgi:hypothetical protein